LERKKSDKMREEGGVHRFLFEHLEIRGALVRLEGCWRKMRDGRGYAPEVARLLGEMAAVTALMASQLKQPGRLGFQFRSSGAISLLLTDCDEALHMRGMARVREDAAVDFSALSPAQLLGVGQGGQLMLSLDLPDAPQPYRSFVPLDARHDSIARIFEHYLTQSEQQAARLFLAADTDAAACLFLQKMPRADARDADGWRRIGLLSASARPEELLRLPPALLLQRLFAEEIAHADTHAQGLRLFAPRAVRYHCPENREKIAAILRALGETEARKILAEHGAIALHDDICNREYRFAKAELDELFKPR
jgi:molecular chaperone Hsp33